MPNMPYMAHLSHFSIYLFVYLFFIIINHLFLFTYLFTITYLFVYYPAIYSFILLLSSYHSLRKSLFIYLI